MAKHLIKNVRQYRQIQVMEILEEAGFNLMQPIGCKLIGDDYECTQPPDPTLPLAAICQPLPDNWHAD